VRCGHIRHILVDRNGSQANATSGTEGSAFCHRAHIAYDIAYSLQNALGGILESLSVTALREALWALRKVGSERIGRYFCTGRRTWLSARGNCIARTAQERP
jgi:hypothetical protein